MDITAGRDSVRVSMQRSATVREVWKFNFPEEYQDETGNTPGRES